MAKQVINTGSTPNARDGDTLYSAFNKVNANFTEVYNQLTPYTAGTGISVTDTVISVAAGYTGQTSITTVSDTTGVTTGVWKATAISPQYGGTGLTTTPIGAMVYGNGTNPYGVISPSATDGGMLRQDAEGAPYWTTNIDGSVQTIKVKQLSVQSAVPAVNDIELGEIVVNTYDGKLFSKKNNGTESIFEIGSGAGERNRVVPFSATLVSVNPTTSTFHSLLIDSGDYSFDRTMVINFTNPNNTQIVTKGTVRVTATNNQIGEHFRITVAQDSSYYQVYPHGSILEFDYTFMNTSQYTNVVFITDTRFVSSPSYPPARTINMNGAGTYEVRDIANCTTLLIYNSADTDPGKFIVRLSNAVAGARVKIKVIGTVIDLDIDKANYPNAGAQTYTNLVTGAVTGNSYEFVHIDNGVWVNLD